MIVISNLVSNEQFNLLKKTVLSIDPRFGFHLEKAQRHVANFQK